MSKRLKPPGKRLVTRDECYAICVRAINDVFAAIGAEQSFSAIGAQQNFSGLTAPTVSDVERETLAGATFQQVRTGG